MALETEVKFYPVDLDRVRACCQEAGGEGLGRYLERNEVFDTVDRALRDRDILLRLRQERGQGAKLTLKLASHDFQGEKAVQAKICEEYEVGVAEVGSMASILTGLGYKMVFRYEKIRETWRLGRVLVCLDRLPFGDYLELEGPLADLKSVAGLLGFVWQAAITATYHALQREQHRQAGLSLEESFVFSSGDPRIAAIDDSEAE
ncbi:adenylate cyclase, class 2 [Desulfovibrionales bacterium]